MTPQQEHIALQNFKTSMIASGHGDTLEYSHFGGYFSSHETQNRWLGYKRCWEEQVLRMTPGDQATVAPDYTPPSPNTEEFVFVGGPLHGLHHLDPNVPWLVTEHNSVQYLYTKVQPAWAGCAPRDNTPFVFVIFATHTLR